MGSDEQTPWSESGERLAAIFDAEFHEWLAWVSPKNLARAYHELRSGLESAGLDSADLCFGCLEGGGPQSWPDPQSPFSYLGWVWGSGVGVPEDDVRDIVNGLPAVGDIEVRFGACYRSIVFECDPSSGPALMKAVRDMALCEVSDWWFAPLLESGRLSAGLASVFEALRDGDSARLRGSMDGMQCACSPDGLEILQNGVSMWQAHWDAMPQELRRHLERS